MAVFIITLIEVMLLIRIGRVLGLGLLLWLVLAAIAGVNLFRYARRNAGRPSTQGAVDARTVALGLADRAVLSAAALLLIIPGLLSDIVALALLIPGNRRALAQGLAARFAGSFTAANDPFTQQERPGKTSGTEPKQGHADGGGQVIEGEFTRRDDPPQRRH